MKGQRMALEVCKVLYRAAYVKVFQFRSLALNSVQPTRVIRHAILTKPTVIPNRDNHRQAENGIEGFPLASQNSINR